MICGLINQQLLTYDTFQVISNMVKSLPIIHETSSVTIKWVLLGVWLTWSRVQKSFLIKLTVIFLVTDYSVPLEEKSKRKRPLMLLFFIFGVRSVSSSIQFEDHLDSQPDLFGLFYFILFFISFFSLFSYLYPQKTACGKHGKRAETVICGLIFTQLEQRCI